MQEDVRGITVPESGGGENDEGGGDGEGGGGFGGVDGGVEGGVEGGVIPMNWWKASCRRFMAPISSCKASISSEHPQVGDGESSCPGSAAAPTLLITQKAESNLSRRAPLGSATFFGCECLA